MFWKIFIPFVINGLIWGFVTRSVIWNKGYDADWFWWGFFFGLLAFAIAVAREDCCRSEVPPSIIKSDSSGRAYNSYPSYMVSSAYGGPQVQEEPLGPGDWRCSCGRANHSYVFTCACGKSKSDLLKADAQPEAAEKAEPASMTEAEDSRIAEENPRIAEEERTVALIRKYKELLDCGAITQGEFDEKKKQLLG